MRRLFVRNILYIAFLGLLFSLPGAVAHAETETPAVPDKGWSLSEDGVLTVYTAEGMNDYGGVTLGHYAYVVEKLIIGPDVGTMYYRRFNIPAKSIEVSPENTTYIMRDGLLIDKTTMTLCAAEQGLVDVVVPGDIRVIAEYAFMGHPDLRSVVLSEGVLELRDWAFAECYALERLQLPVSLRLISGAMLWEDGLNELVIPPNVFFFGQAFNDGVNIDTVVITSERINIGSTDLVENLLPGSLKRLVFLCKPPLDTNKIGFELLLEQEYPEYVKWGWIDENWREQFAVCYLPEYAEYWAPNGETDWNGLPLRPLTKTEMQEMRKLCGRLWGVKADAWPDYAAYPGWEQITSYEVRILTDEGAENFAHEDVFFNMMLRRLVIANGVTAIPDQILQSNNTIYLDVVSIPPSLREIREMYLDSGWVYKAKEIEMIGDNPYFELREGGLVELSTGQTVIELYREDAPEPGLPETAEVSPTPDSAGRPEAESLSAAPPAETAAPDSGAAPESQETGKPDSSFRLGAVGIALLILIAAVALGVVTWRGKRE